MDVQPPNTRSIFERALEFAQGGERKAYLDEACAGKPELRTQVESLLKAHGDAGSFLDGPAFDGQRTSPMEPIAERPGTTIGPYKLLEQIGEGGFGVVFMAEQEQPIRRRVAVKVIKPGMDTRQVIARFEAERQALALMDHPNIARVLDAGATDSGRPYFVMELVRGIPITDFCDQNRMTVDERLTLFMLVCHAVQHAHQKGIIHRDIKPTNVLVTLHDGEPVAKVIDFGVAKATGQRLTDKTIFTAFAQMIGTPLYMSPEQTEMSGLDVDTRSDIYSLGVMLYELLTGSTPFDKERLQHAAYDEIRRIIREEETPKPSTRISTLGATATAISTQRKSDPHKLSDLVRGELDWIVMKCLEKDRNRRYETPNGLAMDVQRYLAGEVVVAAPPSTAYRIRKFVRRHRTPITVTALLAIAALVGTGAYVRAIRAEQKRTESALQVAKVERSRAEDAKHTAEQARLDTEIELQRARLLQVQLELATGDMAKARSLLLQPVHLSLEQEWHWRAWEYARKSRVLRRVDLNINGEVLAPTRTAGHGSLGLVDGHLVAQVAPTAHKPFAVEVDTRLGRPFSGSPAKTLEPGFSVKSISPDDRYVASSVDRGVVEIRDAENRGTLDNIPGAGENIYSLAFDLDGRRLHGLTGDWYVATWLWSASGSPDVDASDTQTKQTRRLKFTPDGRFLACDCYGGSVQIWDAKTHERVREIQGNIRPGITHLVGDASLTPDGQTLLTTASRDPDIHIWRVSDGFLAREIKTDPWTGAGVIRFILNSDGKNLYASGGDNVQARVELWNADAGTMARRSSKLADGAFIYALALSEKHNRLFVCLHPSDQISDNPELRRCLILDATTLQTVGMLPDAHTGGLRDIDLSPDGTLLALCARDGTATIWDWQNQRLLHRLEAKPGRAHSNIISSVRFHPTKNVVATACHDNHLIFWSTDTGRPLADLNVDEQNKLGYGDVGILKDIAFAPDGKTLVITVKEKIWWLDLTCYDDGVANLQAERDHPPKPAASTKASNSWAQAEKIFRRALALQSAGHLNDSIRDYSKAIELEPEYALSYNNLAWLMANCSDVKFRDPAQAVVLATKAVELDPSASGWVNTLGVAHYRARDWKAAIATLEKSIQLRNGGDSFDFFFIAMSKSQLGEKEDARHWYDKAVQWMEKNKSTDEELIRFRSEAAELLGANEKK